MSVGVVVQWHPAGCRTLLRRQCGRVLVDDFLCESVVDRVVERGGLFDEMGGYQPGAKAVVAATRQDRLAAPSAELEIARDGGLQEGGRNRRKEGLYYPGDGFGRAGVQPLLGPVEAANDL